MTIHRQRSRPLLGGRGRPWRRKPNSLNVLAHNETGSDTPPAVAIVDSDQVIDVSSVNTVVHENCSCAPIYRIGIVAKNQGRHVASKGLQLMIAQLTKNERQFALIILLALSLCGFA